jgi:hypothetical protein
MLILIGGAFLVLMLVFSTGLSFFVGLKSPPAKRAGWTVGLSALLTSLVFAWGQSQIADAPDLPAGSPLDEIAWSAPAVILGGAVLVFLFWYWTFRRSWIDDAEALAADGFGIEEDDWRIGLFRLVMLVALAIAISMYRFVIRSAAS